MNRRLVYLEDLQRFSGPGLLIPRALTGAFLVYGVLDNVTSAERMNEFAEFLAQSGFANPGFLAPLSVYAQLVCGVLLILGFLTRWAGIVTAVQFVVALVMVHWSQDFRGWWPAAILVAIGLQYALTGAGSLSIDALVSRRRNNQ